MGQCARVFVPSPQQVASCRKRRGMTIPLTTYRLDFDFLQHHRIKTIDDCPRCEETNIERSLNGILSVCGVGRVEKIEAKNAIASGVCCPPSPTVTLRLYGRVAFRAFLSTPLFAGVTSGARWCYVVSAALYAQAQ